MTGTLWYLAPEVLDVLALIRGTTLKVTACTDTIGRIREEWQRFDDVFVSSLEAWRGEIDPRARAHACDVAAAVTGQRLVGTHYLSDEPALIAIRDAVNVALAAREVAIAA